MAEFLPEASEGWDKSEAESESEANRHLLIIPLPKRMGPSISVVSGSALVTIERRDRKLEDMKALAPKIEFQDMVKFLTQ